MTSVNPIFNNPAATSSTSSASSSAQNAASNVLGPNAFITLLTAQLQAQDPLNPLDPNQMVDELTSMNTLQETIQIRQDLDTLAAAAQSAPGGSTGSAASGASSNTVASTSQGPASNTLAAALSSISVSPAANSVAALYSRLNSQSQLF